MATIRDVAAACGVSAMTVSYVFNDKKGAVSAATRERVLQAAQELGYQPNPIARSLGRRRSDTLGLVVPDWRNSFFVELAETATRVVGEMGLNLFAETRRESGQPFGGWPMDGILAWTPPFVEASDWLGKISTPVMTWRDVRDENIGNAIPLEIYSGARQAAELAAKRPGARWTLVTPYHHNDFRFESRYVAWQEVAQAVGKRFEVVWPQPGDIYEQCRSLGVELAQRPSLARPQVVVGFNDAVALALVNGLRRGGANVPEEIAVAGFDGIAEGRRLDQELTTVSLPLEAMCRAAIGRLLEISRGEEVTPVEPLAAEFLAGETV